MSEALTVTLTLIYMAVRASVRFQTGQVRRREYINAQTKRNHGVNTCREEGRERQVFLDHKKSRNSRPPISKSEVTKNEGGNPTIDAP